MGIGMHSVKSETKCIATIGTACAGHSRLARTSAVRTAAKSPFYCTLLLANNRDTSPAVSMGTALGWAIIGLGLEFF